MDATSMTLAVHEDDPANRFTPLEGAFNVVVRQVPATFIAFCAAMTMNSSQEILFFSESGMLGPDNASGVHLDPIAIGNMIDRSYAGYQEVPLITSEPVNGSEVLIGVSFAALPTEIAD